MDEHESEQGEAGLRQKELDLTPNQREFAESLGIDWRSSDSLTAVLQRVEHELGQRNIHELIRWFLLSVYRHAHKGKWERPQDSDLTEDVQYRLTDQLAGSDEYKLSLLTVLKDSRCRYTLLKFGKSRNPARRTLSNTTKAYKQARQLLLSQEMLPLVAASKAIKPAENPASIESSKTIESSESSESKASSDRIEGGEYKENCDSKAIDVLLPQQPHAGQEFPARESASATAVHRRAARRGFQGGDRVDQGDLAVQSVAAREQAEAAEDALSEEEFEELDKALGSATNSSAQRWTYNTNEERFSLLLGVLAGSAACVLLLWLIY
ncbi:MAG: hypothetical protein O2948_15230 [Proteobacteria bacterium]|nr:hypothetical protein [Pseudomonadota bacterium]MDA0929365.1 hypothetical protein [Pseudomonadota bacterium]